MSDKRIILVHASWDVREQTSLRLGADLGMLCNGAPIQVESRDGGSLDYHGLLRILGEPADLLLLDLRLPSMLAVRAAELAHLARLSTRLVALTSEDPALTRLGVDLSGAIIPLFDAGLALPWKSEIHGVTLRDALGGCSAGQGGRLSQPDLLDAALERLFQVFPDLLPGARGSAHAFGVYRDTYLQSANTPARTDAGSGGRPGLEAYARVRPVLFSPRLIQAAERISRSPYFAWEQREFLQKRVDYLLDVTGRVLVRFRQEVEDILIGLEQFACMCETGPRQEQVDISELAQMLMVRAQRVPGFEEGIAPIVYYLLHLRNVWTPSQVGGMAVA